MTSINDAKDRAVRRKYSVLNRQLSNGDKFLNCDQCDRKFYPLYSSCFCSKKCVQEAFRTLSEDCQVEKLSQEAALDMLSFCSDTSDLDVVRKIARLGRLQKHFYKD